MRFRSKPRWSRNLECAAALGLAALPALACGPDFPNSHLGATDAELLAAPEGYFSSELARLAGPHPSVHRAVEPARESADAHRQRIESNQLVDALTQAGADQAEARVRAQQFAQWRSAPPTPSTAEPPGIPSEFLLYARGAAAWRAGDWPAAEKAWTDLLALPEAQRRFRTVWVAYMFGRSSVVDGQCASTYPRAGARAEAQRWFRLVRDLAASGWPDPLGLAAESYGWEARAALDAGEPAEAARLYLRQYSTGDATASASLRRVTRQLLEPKLDTEAARDPLLRSLMIGYIVSRVGNSLFDDEPGPPFARWAIELAAPIEQSGANAIAEADRLAWLAYEGGQFELAARWAKLAPADATMARWIRAKLALRAGDTAEGARLLDRVAAAPDLDLGMRAAANAELGRARLALGDFENALAAWLHGGHWQDAAYVAERLLTAEELKAFVTTHAPPAAIKPPTGTAENGWYRRGYRWLPDNLGTALRHLLGRRLAREGRVEEAEPYFPEALRPTLHAYGADVRTGFDAERPAAERAAAFWRAAQTAREHGLELLGTELDPDWYIWGAQYATAPSAELRQESAGNKSRTFAMHETERDRLEQLRIPTRRFHYRYRAADLASWAAALLPNDDEQTAAILWQAGRWLAGRDPEAADTFYRLLVVRCPHTTLGRRAATYHWLPDPAPSAPEQDDCPRGHGDE